MTNLDVYFRAARLEVGFILVFVYDQNTVKKSVKCCE